MILSVELAMGASSSTLGTSEDTINTIDEPYAIELASEFDDFMMALLLSSDPEKMKQSVPSNKFMFFTLFHHTV